MRESCQTNPIMFFSSWIHLFWSWSRPTLSDHFDCTIHKLGKVEGGAFLVNAWRQRLGHYHTLYQCRILYKSQFFSLSFLILYIRYHLILGTIMSNCWTFITVRLGVFIMWIRLLKFMLLQWRLQIFFCFGIRVSEVAASLKLLPVFIFIVKNLILKMNSYSIKSNWVTYGLH
jgi:hypothetical protein